MIVTTMVNPTNQYKYCHIIMTNLPGHPLSKIKCIQANDITGITNPTKRVLAHPNNSKLLGNKLPSN